MSNKYFNTYLGIIRKQKGKKMSLGEIKIADFLMKNNITFIREYVFTDLFLNNDFKLLFFDFYLPDYNLCIEFDGIQHQTGIYMGKKDKKIKIHDYYKNQYCYKKSIKLLRIKHTEINKIDDIICQYFDNHSL